MARLTLTPDLASMVEFDDVGIRMSRLVRRRGGGRRHRLRRMAGETRREETWRLRGLTFAVAEGESLAIVGARGSGRELVLRLAGGTLIPEEGRVRRRLPVTPMIEVAKALGRGLTVRQNIYVVGGLLAMTPEQVTDRLDEIVDFAGVGPILDKYLGAAIPMVRQKLAWSITMATQSRAFAIDQTLVVGDREFRQACWTRVDQMRADGVTFLISSDSPKQLRRFCDRAIVLDDGALVAQTSVAEGIALLRQSRRKGAAPELDDTESSGEGDSNAP